MKLCTGHRVVFCAILLLFAVDGASNEPGKNVAKVTLTVTKVRAVEYFSTALEGEFNGMKIRNVLMACDVVIDNQTGEDLTIQSNFSSAIDYLTLELLRGDKIIVEEHYISHLSPSSSDGKPFVLKKGKTLAEMRFPIRLPPKDWPQLQARLYGFLPGSNYKGVLESNKLKVRRVVDLNSPAK